MATIDDFGDTAEPLNNPVLGGPSGWAAAVRDYLKSKVVQTDGSVPMTAELTVPSIFLNGQVRIVGSDVDGLSAYNEAVDALETMSMADPAHPHHGATKSYVDARIKSGRVLVVTDSSGIAQLAHGMGVRPNVVFLDYDYTMTDQTPGILSLNPYILALNWDSSVINFQVENSVGVWAPIGNTYIGIKWMALP